jgi:hypothetical protein
MERFFKIKIVRTLRLKSKDPYYFYLYGLPLSSSFPFYNEYPNTMKLTPANGWERYNPFGIKSIIGNRTSRRVAQRGIQRSKHQKTE